LARAGLHLGKTTVGRMFKTNLKPSLTWVEIVSRS